MNPSILRITRWSLVAVSSIVLCYLPYLWIAGMLPMILEPQATVGSILALIMVTLLFGVATLIPAVMVYSLISKKLIGLASCVGMVIALAAFCSTIVLLHKSGLMAFWISITFIPVSIKAICGIVLSIALVTFPFWLLVRLIRLSNEWFYPKFLKPLEEKL